MDKYIIKSERPNCSTCGEPMEEWSPFADTHEHIECTSDMIVASMMQSVKDDLKKFRDDQLFNGD